MQRMTKQILEYAKRLPQGGSLAAKGLLHIGQRAAVDQALSRLVKRGQLTRAGRGVYLAPVTSRFGIRSPSVEQAVGAIATQRGEVIVPSGAAAACQHLGPHDPGADQAGIFDVRAHPEDKPWQTGGGTSPRSALAARHGASAGRPGAASTGLVGAGECRDQPESVGAETVAIRFRRTGRSGSAASDLARAQRGESRLWLSSSCSFRLRTAARR